PVGITNDTILRGTPNFSIALMAFGKAASELVVAKAIETGSFTASINFLTGIFKNIITGTNTSNKNKINARYNDPNNINTLLRKSLPAQIAATRIKAMPDTTTLTT